MSDEQSSSHLYAGVRALVIAAAFGLVSLLFTASGESRATAAPSPLGLVRMSLGTAPQTVADVLARAHLTQLDEIGEIGVHRVVPLDGTDLQGDLSAVASQSEVLGAEADAEVHSDVVPNDPYYTQYQWNLRRIALEQAWDLRPSAPGITVAVLDTGVDFSHPDLAPNLLTSAGFDFINGAAQPVDDSADSHGTSVAGVVGALGNNRDGVTGVAWKVKILPLKTLDATGFGTDSTMARAVIYAADHGAQIINISSSGTQYVETLASAVAYAQSKGVLVVAAAGNATDASTEPRYPAALDGVLAVSAIDQQDRLPSFAPRAPYVSLTAPGVDVETTARVGVGGAPYQQVSGTSMAAPHVSGLAALLWSLRPDYSAADIAAVIKGTADRVGTPDSQTGYGAGLIDAARAVAAVRLGVPPTSGKVASLPGVANGAPPSPPAPLAPDGRQWFFAEGSTKQPFDTSFAVQNPTVRPTTVHFTFLSPDGTRSTADLPVGPNSRASLRVADVLPNADFGTQVDADTAVFVERSMYFGHDGHSAIGARAPARSWYLAEGSAGPPFDTWVLLMNPGNAPATVAMTFMQEDGGVVTHTEVVPPYGRRSVYTNLLLPAIGFSTQISSDQPVVAERSMYFDHGGGGHDTLATSSPGKTWYVAAGASRAGIDTWLLLQNPNNVRANTNVTFFTDTGNTVVQPIGIAPHARMSVYTNLVIPSGAYGMKVDSDQPIVAERAMYVAGGRAGLDSAAVSSPAPEWFFPEGSTQGSFEEQLTVLNPNSQAATVEADFVNGTGDPLPSQVFTINASTSTTIDVNALVPDSAVSMHVFSDKPIGADRTSFFATSNGLGATGSAGAVR